MSILLGCSFFFIFATLLVLLVGVYNIGTTKNKKANARLMVLRVTFQALALIFLIAYLQLK